MTNENFDEIVRRYHSMGETYRRMKESGRRNLPKDDEGKVGLGLSRIVGGVLVCGIGGLVLVSHGVQDVVEGLRKR